MVLPLVYGSTYSKRLVAFYVAIYFKRFGEYPRVNYSIPFFVQMKRAFEKYGEIKVAGAILFHFEQNGEKIQKEKFPLMWVFKSIPEYMQKLQDFHGIDIDNETELYQAIRNRLNFLDVSFTL